MDHVTRRYISSRPLEVVVSFRRELNYASLYDWQMCCFAEILNLGEPYQVSK